MFAKLDQDESFGGPVMLAAGEAGRTIRMQRMIFSGTTGGTVRLVSDPGGAGQADLCPSLFFRPNVPIDLALSVIEAVAAPSGKSVGVVVTLASGSANYSVNLWYDLV